MSCQTSCWMRIWSSTYFSEIVWNLANDYVSLRQPSKSTLNIFEQHRYTSWCCVSSNSNHIGSNLLCVRWRSNFWGSHPKLPESSSAWGENKIDSSDGPHCMVLLSLRTTRDTGAKIAADEVWQKGEVLPSYPWTRSKWQLANDL